MAANDRVKQWSRICPFCKKQHDVRACYLNTICGCGGKYYANTGVWLNRNTGEKVSVTMKIIEIADTEDENG